MHQGRRRSCPYRAICRAVLAACAATFSWTGAAHAQILIPGDHHLKLGEPPLLTLRVRLPPDQEIAGILPPRCLSASLYPLDPRDGSSVLLEWQDAQRDSDGSTWVTLGHPAPLRLMRMRLQATIHCGPPYTRLQQLHAQGIDAEEQPPVPHADVTAAPTTARGSTRSPPPSPPPLSPPPRPVRPTVTRAPSTPHAEQTTRASMDVAPILSPDMPAPARPGDSASPLTDAFTQTWQKDLHALRDQLQPLQRQVDRQEERLKAQESQMNAGLASLAGLFVLGVGHAMVTAFLRVWRERRLRRFHEDATNHTTPKRSRPVRPPDVPVDLEGDWIGTPHPHPDAAAAASHAGMHELHAAAQATLDESRHQALYDEVDALRGVDRHGAAIALLEAALPDDNELPPGLLLRLLDLHRRLGQLEAPPHVAQPMLALYAIDLPPIERCVLVEDLDPGVARARLLTNHPQLDTHSAEERLQRLARALVIQGDPGEGRLNWPDFLTALAWHAALAVSKTDQTSTRSMPPVLACCT